MRSVSVVALLAGEGMSTRAIAPIVGASKSAVDRDVQVSHAGTPDVSPAAPPFDPETGELLDDEPEPEPSNIVGLDAKTYKRPKPGKGKSA